MLHKFLPLCLAALLAATPAKVSSASQPALTSGMVQIWTFCHTPQTHRFMPDFSGVGSGFVLNDKGVVVTNHHVVALTITGKDEKGNGYSVPCDVTIFVTEDGSTFDLVRAAKSPNGSLIWSSESRDLALIQTSGLLDRTPVTLTEHVPTQGDPVLAVGFPYIADRGLAKDTKERRADATVTSGVLGREIADVRLGDLPVTVLQHDAQIQSGNSGGPLLDSCHRVVGVNTAVAMNANKVQASGISYATRIDNLIKELTRRKIPFNQSADTCKNGVLTQAAAASPQAAPDDATKTEPAAGETKPAPEEMPVPQAGGGEATPTKIVQNAPPAPTPDNSLLLIAGALGLVLLALGYVFFGRKRNDASSAHNLAPGNRAPYNVSMPTVDVSAHTVDLSGFADMPIVELVDTLSKTVVLRLLPQDFARGDVSIGRDSSSAFIIPDESQAVSRRHFLLTWKDGALWISDLGSTNGTRLDGRPVGKNYEHVKSNATISIAKRDFTIRFT